MNQNATDELRNEFRARYRALADNITAAVQRRVDVNLLALLGDKLDAFVLRYDQHRTIFDEPECTTLHDNLLRLQTDIQLQYAESSELSHQGHCQVVQHVQDGRQGRPQIQIDPDFLAAAYSIAPIQRIADFLNVGQSTVRKHLLELGLAEPGLNPFVENESGVISYTRPVTAITNEELDGLIREVHNQHNNQGISMLRGTLQTMGYVIPKECIRQSLRWLFPTRLFSQAPIERRSYSVPGPNALWHHDGQHGLIRWGIVIHGFIDGYSRLITGLRAANNNRGETVLRLFLDAVRIYKVPVRLRGDHGTENLLVAAWMERFRGNDQSAYIWGRSVHNIRIERLWVDVTMQVGSKWSGFFTTLEQQGGLDINNVNHIWLLHELFLTLINDDLSEFALSWNHHAMRIRNALSRSPWDMFFFDMVALGERGDDLPQDEGINTYTTDGRLCSVHGEGSQAWRTDSGVSLEPPNQTLDAELVTELKTRISALHVEARENYTVTVWFEALAFLRGRVDGF